jgi:hypothetical protein
MCIGELITIAPIEKYMWNVDVSGRDNTGDTEPAEVAAGNPRLPCQMFIGFHIGFSFGDMSVT